MAATPERIGAYTITGELGRGGMGVVYRARQPGLDREVAIKVLLGGAHSDPSARERFLREAKATAQLRHPNIVSVYDAGMEGELPYIVMDFIAGQSLDAAITEGEVSAAQAAEITRQIGEALHYAHEQGLIHRDVKPANVLLDASGRAFLTDFGLARQVSDASGLTASGAVLGTPSYMAPEQAQGRTADARSDVYGLGALLYEMCAGRPPFEGDTAVQTLARVVRDDPMPPRRLSPQMSRQLELVCLTALAKEPERRYQTAAAMAEDCRRVLADEPIAARAPSAIYRLRRAARRHRVVVAALGLAAAGTLGGVYLLAVRPAQQARAADLQALDAAVTARERLAREFDAAVAAGRFDDAIALGKARHGTTPPLPRVRDAALAELPAYAPLHRPIAMDLAPVYLARGRARIAADDPLGRHDFVAAFRTGREPGASRDAARDGLLELVALLHAEGASTEAERTARLCAASFGTGHPTTRVWLARLRGAAGAVAEAAQWWHSLRDVPAHAEEASRVGGVVQALCRLQARAQMTGLRAAGDLDGDGRPEALFLEHGWRLVVRESGPSWKVIGRPQRVPDPPPLRPDLLQVLDLDGDGRPEIVMAAGMWNRKGKLIVARWTDQRLQIVGTAPLLARALAVARADLDRDGTPELIVATDWHDRALRVYRVGAGVRELYAWSVLSSPFCLTALPDGRLLLGLGPWAEDMRNRPAYQVGRSGRLVERLPEPRPWGYRLMLLAPDGRGLYRDAGGTTRRFSGGRICWIGPDEFLIAAGTSPAFRKVMPDLAAGVWRYRITPDGFDAGARLDAEWGDYAEPHAPVLWPNAGGPFAATLVGPTLHLSPLDGSPALRIRTSGAAAIDALQMDDDPELELALDQPGSGRLLVYGAGRFAPGKLPAVESGAAAASGTVPPEQELLEAGLYDEVIEACREELAHGADAAMSYRLGVALAARERWAEAAAAFGDAMSDRARAVDAALRRAHVLEEARDWDTLAECLQTLRDTPGVDPMAAELAERRLRFARGPRNLRVRVHWKPGQPFKNLFCDNPMKVRRTDRALSIWNVSDTDGQCTGELFHYRGGPLRARFRFRTTALQWATSIHVGLQHARAVSDEGWKLAGPTIEFTARAGGNTKYPVVDATLNTTGTDGEGSSDAGPSDGWIPAAGTVYEVTFEYVPGFERVWCDVTNTDSGAVELRLHTRLRQRLEHGDYFLGRTATRRRAAENGQHFNKMELLEMELRAWNTTGMRTPPQLDEHLLLGLANGALVQNDLARAGKLLEAVARRLGRTRPGEFRARFYLSRALWRLRTNAPGGAQNNLAAAVKADTPTVVRAFKNQAPAALTNAERQWVGQALAKIAPPKKK